ncbi:MAG: alpha/beta hydrolase, partial [Bacteroidota bacterium]
PLLNQYAVSMFQFYAKQEIAAGNFVEEWQRIQDFFSGVDSLNITDEESGQINSFGFDAESYLVTSSGNSSGGSRRWEFLSSPIAPLTVLISNRTADIIGTETERTSLTPQLNKIRIPSLFVSGKYDFVVPPRLAESAFEAVSTTEKRLHIFENSGHSPMDTEPEAFANVLIDFIETYK